MYISCIQSIELRWTSLWPHWTCACRSEVSASPFGPIKSVSFSLDRWLPLKYVDDSDVWSFSWLYKQFAANLYLHMHRSGDPYLLTACARSAHLHGLTYHNQFYSAEQNYDHLTSKGWERACECAMQQFNLWQKYSLQRQSCGTKK